MNALSAKDWAFVFCYNNVQERERLAKLENGEDGGAGEGEAKTTGRKGKGPQYAGEQASLNCTGSRTG